MMNFRKKQSKYRILSIDGGGLKGVFTAYALWKLEEDYDIKILDYFNMIVGTSTGALIATALLNGSTSKEIYDIYSEKENKIFESKKGMTDQFKSIFFAGYNAEPLEKYLKEEVGNDTLKSLYAKSGKDFAFFSSNFTKAKPVIYSSPSLSGSDMLNSNSTLFNVLRTTTAAPFYFEPLKDKNTNNLILDGGLWANNPSLIALNLALSNKKIKIDMNDIEILSFGQTFTQDMNFEIPKGTTVLKSPMKNQFVQLLLSVLILNQNSQTSLVKNLLGNAIYRYEPEIPQSGVSVDMVSQKFLNYTKIYWEENKETLIQFIKTGENMK